MRTQTSTGRPSARWSRPPDRARISDTRCAGTGFPCGTASAISRLAGPRRPNTRTRLAPLHGDTERRSGRATPAGWKRMPTKPAAWHPRERADGSGPRVVVGVVGTHLRRKNCGRPPPLPTRGGSLPRMAAVLPHASPPPNNEITGRRGALTLTPQSLAAAAVRCTDGFCAARCSLGLAQVHPHLVLATGNQVRSAVGVPVRHPDAGPELDEGLVEEQRFRLRQFGFPLRPDVAQPVHAVLPRDVAANNEVGLPVPVPVGNAQVGAHHAQGFFALRPDPLDG